MTDRTATALARVALAVFVVVGAVLSDRPLAVLLPVAAGTLAVVAVLPAGSWQVAPGAGVVGAGVTVLCAGSTANVGWFALCLLTGWCVLAGSPVLGVAFSAVALAVEGLHAALIGDSGGLAWLAGTVLTLVGSLVGRRQLDLVEQLRQAQAGLADRVRLEERGRVARELHDVVAHSLTVSLLHVSSARLAVQEDPMQAVEALEQAELLGQRSLTEVRAAVGLLREGPAGAPLPDAAQLPELVAGFRQAGATVDYRVVGDTGGLPATTGLALYRILQESLTNAARHGDGAPTAVRLRVGAQVELTVDSSGGPGVLRPGGAGLVGMRERAEALGGRVTAGPHAAGWRVSAVLPA